MDVDVARELAVLLTVAFAGYLLAAFSRQSVAIGEILVGLAVGPSLLGIVHPTEFVGALALIGALVLLFAVGLAHEFRDSATEGPGAAATNPRCTRAPSRPGDSSGCAGSTRSTTAGTSPRPWMPHPRTGGWAR